MENKLINPRVCLALTKGGLTAYCNRDALKALSQRLNQLVDSPISEHYESHVIMEISDEKSLFEENSEKNAWVLFEKSLANSFDTRSPTEFGFELTFMTVDEAELDDMVLYQKTGVLPPDWGQVEDDF